MDPTKPNPLALKELLFVKSSLADRVKNFLPQIAKANDELEKADEETRKSMILEQLEQLKDESSDDSDESDSFEDEEEDSELEDEEANGTKGGHVEIVFTKFEEREPSPESASSEETEKKNDEEKDDDFVIRRSDVSPKNSK